MSLLSRGLGALGNAVKSAVPGLVARAIPTVARAIPGIGTAIAVAGTVGTVLSTIRGAGGKTSGATVPAIPSGPMPGPGMTTIFAPQGAPVSLGGGSKSRVHQTFAAWGLDPAQYGPQIDYWARQIDSGAATFAHLEADLPSAGGRRPTTAIATMGAAQMGAVPGWGNLAQRAARVAAPVAGRIGTWIAIGGGLLGLYDAAGNLIATKKKTRRMNVLNPRALSRANRRLCGFRDVATRALKQYGYSVSTTRSSSRATTRKGKGRSCKR